MKLILPVLADIGHGILATLVVGIAVDVPLTWHFFVGIAFALLPDLDAVPRLVRTGSVVATKDEPQDHREYLHYPILFLVIGFLILSFSTFWGLLFVVATMLHFFNDTWGTGHGLAWFAPFFKKTFKLKTFNANRPSKAQSVSHKPSNGWIDETYLRLNSVSVIEYTIFGIALIALFLYFFY